MKQLCMFFSILLTMHFLFSPMIICSSNPMQLDFLNLPDQNVYWQGWVKYFHYNNNTRFEKPKSFYQNNEYFHQRIPNSLYHESDNFGTLRIPSKHSFFLVLFNDSLTLHTTRYDIFRKSYDSLRIDHINLVPEDQPLKGGVKDLGNFDEGKCIEIKVTVPRVYRSNFSPINNFNGLLQTWIICNNDGRAKSTLLATLLKMKLKSQRNHDAVLTYDAIYNKKKGRKFSMKFGKKNKKRGKPVNGYWVLLQNWTECTLKCGGGKSYQQWLCIPPKNGGKKCEGFSVRVKDCNTQKCPSHGVVLKRHLMQVKQEEENAAKPPIIKVAAFSTRPQRYTKCILKENDAFLTDFNPETREMTKQPVRLVMNNQTITLYSDDDYENKIYTYNIDSTSLTRTDEFCCVRFRDALRSYKLCGFTSNCGTRLNNLWVEDWIKDFKLFKQECRTKRQVSSANRNVIGASRRNGKKKGGDDIGEIFDETMPNKEAFGGSASGVEGPGQELALPGQKGPNAPKNELARQAAIFKQKFTRELQSKIINKREKKIMKKVRKTNRKVARGKVMQTENMGLAVMGKEMELEKLIKTEEKKRENRKMKKLIKIIKKEKQKKNCLFKAIKKRELDTQILLEKREAEKEINSVKEELKMEVQMKRNEMKRQISQMRKKSRRRRAALENRLNKIRTQMARAIMESNKEGDIELCRKGKKSPSQRDNYCNTNFVDDYLKNYDCKQQESFCYMCCENEFGNNFLDKRDECYDMCDGTVNKSGLPSRKVPKRTNKKKPLPKLAVDVLANSFLKNSGISIPKRNKMGGWVWTPKINNKTGRRIN